MNVLYKYVKVYKNGKIVTYRNVYADLYKGMVLRITDTSDKIVGYPLSSIDHYEAY